MSWNCCNRTRCYGGCTRPCNPVGSGCGGYRPDFGGYNPCGSCYGSGRCGSRCY